MEHVLTYIRTNPKYCTDFASLCGFIATEVDAKTQRVKQLKDATRTVARIQQGGGDGGGRGKGKDKGGNGNNRPSKFVDGKMVYGKLYNAKEFGALTKKQKETVIELKRQYNNNKHNGGGQVRGVKGLAAAVQDVLTSIKADLENQMESSIISAVQRASNENVDDTGTRVTFNDDTTIASAGSKRKQATSGSVGRFLDEQRKQKKDS